ncbi:hypothetical protein ACFL43_04075 [Thermodesulfobacteriota bacterium]
MAISLRRFIPAAPEDFLEGSIGEWVVIILLCCLFIALCGAVLPKRLTENRYGKPLIVSLGLILGVGLYMSKDIYNFNFESFGFVSIWLIIVLVGFVTFGLFRYGMRIDTAFAMTYCVIYLSFAMITPSLFDSIADSFPIMNMIFLLTFGYLLVRIIIKIVSRKKTAENAAFEFKHDKVPPADQAEIERELDFDKEEKKDLKKKTSKLSDIEINKIEDIEKLVTQFIKTLKKNPSITEDERENIAVMLNKIAAKKKDFETGLQILDRHLEKYQRGDEQQIHELGVRLAEAKDKHKKSEIRKELDFEKRKIEIFEFMKRDKDRLITFLQFFEKEMYNAVQYLRQSNVPQSINRLSMVKKQLGTMKNILKDLTGFVSYLIKYSKKEEKILKKEEQGR